MKLRFVPPNKNQPYSDGDIELLLSVAPTRENVMRLSVVLGRSRKAIRFLYKIAYSGEWLKSAKTRGHNNVIVKLARIKRKLGIAVGHRGTRA